MAIKIEVSNAKTLPTYEQIESIIEANEILTIEDWTLTINANNGFTLSVLPYSAVVDADRIHEAAKQLTHHIVLELIRLCDIVGYSSSITYDNS